MINANPPPLGFNLLWELLLLGMSGINFLNGLIKNLVRDKLKIKLKVRIRNIFKIIFKKIYDSKLKNWYSPL